MNQKKNMDEQILRLMDEHPSEGVSLLMEQYMGLLWSACKLYLDDPEDIGNVCRIRLWIFMPAESGFVWKRAR